jgi:23S rRNA (guanosine2251-2'-O)-methyltransferase
VAEKRKSHHVEGRPSVLAALQVFERKFQVVLLSRSAHAEKFAEIEALAERRGVPVRRVEPAELTAVAHGTTHGGVVALCSERPRTTGEQLLRLLDQRAAAPLLLLIEGVDDERNLGFTLRSAEALGADAVLIKKHLWDFDAVEVGRPSSGALERLPLVQIQDLDLLRQLQGRGVQVLGCIAGARMTIHQADLRRPSLLAVGGEKRGLSGAVRSICDRLVTIPTRSAGTSLSMSHAAAVVMAEAMRQRQGPTPV